MGMSKSGLGIGRYKLPSFRNRDAREPCEARDVFVSIVICLRAVIEVAGHWVERVAVEMADLLPARSWPVEGLRYEMMNWR